MPNTLAHIAVQSLILRVGGIFSGFLSAVLLSCIIPDIPWIIQRLASMAGDSVDLYQLRAYSTVQATLLFSMALSGAFALIFIRPWLAWAVISAGSLLHLLLDASEIKWGNGVHFFAPLDWTHISWGILWPEHWLVYTVSLGGVAIFFCLAFRSLPPYAGLTIDWRRLIGIATILLFYFLTPLALLQGPIRADNHYLATLSDREKRPGLTLELDRTSVFAHDNEWFVRTYAGEVLSLEGRTPSSPGDYSLKGLFLDERRLLVEDFHAHDGHRDAVAILGLLFVFGWFAVAFYSNSRNRRRRRPVGA